ncbi:MAG: alpha/beta fold hydrolase, partial [Acidimicrobiales bacterium]
EHGEGLPLLLIAQGAMNSTVDKWAGVTLNPLAVFADDFRMIAMDQRNAGRSAGPLDVDDPWGGYARDQLALMDHLGVESFNVMGCCIGGSFVLRLIQQAPARVAAGVLEQPIGIQDDNAHLFEAMWRSWGADLAERRSDIDVDRVEAFGTRMWDGDFVVSVSRDFVRSCPTPLLVLPGTDQYHPTATGREIADLAPPGEVVEPWNDSSGHQEGATRAVRRFFQSHPPG